MQPYAPTPGQPPPGVAVQPQPYPPQPYPPQPYPPQPYPGGYDPVAAAAQAKLLAHIETQANASLLWGCIGVVLFGVVLGPAAFIRGTMALRLIAQHGIGREHATKARAGQIVGLVTFILWLVAMVVLIIPKLR